MKQKLVKIIEDLTQGENYKYWEDDENAKRLIFYIKQKPIISKVIDILSGISYVLITFIYSLVMLHMLEGTYVLQGLEAKIVIKYLYSISIFIAVLFFVGRRFLMNKYFSVEMFFSCMFYIFILLVGYMDAEANYIYIPLLLIYSLNAIMRYLWKMIDFREKIADGSISKFNTKMQDQKGENL